MSTLKVNTISNNGTETDTPQGFTIAGNSIVQGYTESASEPSVQPNEGDIWWDTTNSVVKRYVNDTWRTITTISISAADFFGDRGVFLGDYSNGTGAASTDMDYIDITTTGNASDFGDFHSGSAFEAKACSSGSRIIFSVAQDGDPDSSGSGTNNRILYITPSTPSNSSEFGDMTVSGRRGAAGDGARGLFAGASVSNSTFLNTVDYVTIDTTGNAVDFGDLTTGCTPIGISNATYAIFGLNRKEGSGSYPQTLGTTLNGIDRLVVQTLGNATDFGDITVSRHSYASGCDATRGCFSGGETSNLAYTTTNVIDYITIATPSNAIDFGDLSDNGIGSNGRARSGGTSNSTRCVNGGGYQYYAPSSNWLASRSIDYWTTQTLGNSSDFGDLLHSRTNLGASSGAAS